VLKEKGKNMKINEKHWVLCKRCISDFLLKLFLHTNGSSFMKGPRNQNSNKYKFTRDNQRQQCRGRGYAGNWDKDL